MQVRKTPQPLQQHEYLLAPWVKVGTDIFTINNENFLIISEYYSRYLFIKKLPFLNTAAPIRATKECSSLLGIPREIMSDNGSQFRRDTMSFMKNGTLYIHLVALVMPKSN